jgi:hypothetical protein
MNRKNTAATDRLIDAEHGSYEHGMRTVIRLANVTLWWKEKWLEVNVLRGKPTSFVPNRIEAYYSQQLAGFLRAYK